MRLLYRLLTVLLTPAFVCHLLVRSWRSPQYRRRMGERFGFGFSPVAVPSIWIHAVSVGEVQAAVPLVHSLRGRYPRQPLVFTTMTPTGSAHARELFGDSVIHSYVPYDGRGSVQRFFHWARPTLAIILETEIWPHLFAECGARGVPLVLASARISSKSVRRYRLLFGLIKDTLSHGILIAAQSETDAERFRALGVNPGRTHVTGNIKFDFEVPAEFVARGQEFRRRHMPGRPVWIAASTHSDEERLVLQAHRRVLEIHPTAVLILVPRHPERFAAVGQLLERENLSFVTRSGRRQCPAEVSIFLGDSMGELRMLYGAADVAFVGGSLVPVGGHNLLEPAALGVPVITGPNNFNAADIADLLMEKDATLLVHDEIELGAEIARLLADEEERARRGRLGRAAVDSNRGALDRLLNLINPVIAKRLSFPPDAPTSAASRPPVPHL